jgi:hypothetical protein
VGEPPIAAIGRLPGEEAWVGFRHDHGGYRLVFGRADGTQLTAPASEAELLALAVAYFEELLDEPPPDLEATQGDIAAVCRWLSTSSGGGQIGTQLREAVDAIDDGLGTDVTVGRLSEALQALANEDEQADPLDLLVRRYRALGR